MKKLCFIAVIAIFSTISINAQEVNFGATAGFLSGNEKIEGGGVSLSASESGFYVGLIAEISMLMNLKFNLKYYMQKLEK